MLLLGYRLEIFNNERMTGAPACMVFATRMVESEKIRMTDHHRMMGTRRSRRRISQSS